MWGHSSARGGLAVPPAWLVGSIVLLLLMLVTPLQVVFLRGAGAYLLGLLIRDKKAPVVI